MAEIMSWAETLEQPDAAAQRPGMSMDDGRESSDSQMGFSWEGRSREASEPLGASTPPESASVDSEADAPGAATMSTGLDEWLENRVSLVDDSGLRAMGVAAEAHGYLWVGLKPPGPQFRGRLGLYIEESVEAELERLGALSPGIHASTGLDASLSDQLYRARLVEKCGLALTIPSLEGICNLGRILDADDGAVLRWWIAAAADRPVQVVVSRKNNSLRVYPSPVLFESLFEVGVTPLSPRPPCAVMAESVDAMALSELPPAVESSSAAGAEVEPLDEACTNVLGTDVETLEDEDVLSLWAGSDIALPDLDDALGLSGREAGTDGVDAETEDAAAPEVMRADAEPVKAEPSLVPAAEPAVEEDDTSPTLARDDVGETSEAELSVHAAPTQRPLAPEVSIPELDLRRASEELGHLAEESAALDASRHAAPEKAIDEFDELEGETPLMPLSVLAPPRGETDAPELVRGELNTGAPMSEGRLESENCGIDPDEFLRTLAQDSARAPEVVQQRPSGAASPTEPDECTQPTPLPTKKIKPFLRLATDEAEQAPAAELEVDSAGLEETNASLTSPDAPVVAEPVSQEEDALADVSAQEKRPALDEAESVEPESDELLASAGAGELPTLDPEDPFNRLAQREWRKWAKNLSHARGPKPLSVVERMFVTDYTRLREAARRNLVDDAARDVLEEWRDSFAKSYTEAFDALRVRGKRPTMVLDLPEVAQRLARLQGARRLQLLLVDGMRFDLGLMIQERMKSRVDAALTERLLLWSALPTTTATQLELLGRGPDGLREPLAGEDEPPTLVARGKAAMTARRIRTGHLEVYKIDVIEDALRQVGKPMIARFGQIADDTAEAIRLHLDKQAPRTLVMVFGDHGFAIDPTKEGTTSEVKQGGASPEEVLVPAFAWLTGAVH